VSIKVPSRSKRIPTIESIDSLEELPTVPAFAYCSKCGSPLAIDRVRPFAEQKCFCCGTTHYHNSKPTAGALILDADRILLSQRAGEPYRGDWDVPGGFLEAGESPTEGVKREIREETSLEIELFGSPEIEIGRYGPTGDFVLSIYYRARILSGEPHEADDVAALRWFRLDQLPPNLAWEHERALLGRLATEPGS
jgi:ADP-ribose pyrophosphatase YjhB (NUDIX family)